MGGAYRIVSLVIAVSMFMVYVLLFFALIFSGKKRKIGCSGARNGILSPLYE